MTRSDQLLKAAADALDDGRAPFEHAFLVEYDVTFDEACTLAQTLAAAACLWLTLSPKDRCAALMAQVAEQTGSPRPSHPGTRRQL